MVGASSGIDLGERGLDENAAPLRNGVILSSQSNFSSFQIVTNYIDCDYTNLEKGLGFRLKSFVISGLCSVPPLNLVHRHLVRLRWGSSF